MSRVEVPAEVAAHVLWHFDSGGVRAGSFTMSLIETIAAADPGNRARLALGFPEHVAAVELAQARLDGIERLRDLAGSWAGAR